MSKSQGLLNATIKTLDEINGLLLDRGDDLGAMAMAYASLSRHGIRVFTLAEADADAIRSLVVRMIDGLKEDLVEMS